MDDSYKIIFLDINNIIADEIVDMKDGDDIKQEIKEKFEFLSSIINNFIDNHILVDIEKEENYIFHLTSFIYQIEKGMTKCYKFYLFRQISENLNINIECNAFFIIINLEKQHSKELLERLIENINNSGNVNIYFLGYYKSKNDIVITKKDIEDLFIDQDNFVEHKYLEININENQEEVNEKMDKYIEELMNDIYLEEMAINIGSTSNRIKNYDRQLYGVARWGKFGAAGTRVLPQVKVAENPKAFKRHIDELGPENMYFGFDFGFEESFNAVVCMSLDTKKSVLYVWDEIYRNQITDDKFAQLPKMQKLKKRIEYYNRQGYNKTIVADNEDPKAISYYRQVGFTIRACRNKFAGSRLSNTRKIKRIESIVISPKCQNTIRELRWLTYKKDAKGNVIYDEFNIDPHTFSAIWYALDMVTIADFKGREYYSKTG